MVRQTSRSRARGRPRQVEVSEKTAGLRTDGHLGVSSEPRNRKRCSTEREAGMEISAWNRSRKRASPSLGVRYPMASSRLGMRFEGFVARGRETEEARAEAGPSLPVISAVGSALARTVPRAIAAPVPFAITAPGAVVRATGVLAAAQAISLTTALEVSPRSTAPTLSLAAG